MVERCELLAKAKVLAVKKKLDPNQVRCPAVDICRGATCVFPGVDLENVDTETQEPVIVQKGVNQSEHHL